MTFLGEAGTEAVHHAADAVGSRVDLDESAGNAEPDVAATHGKYPPKPSSWVSIVAMTRFVAGSIRQ